MRPAPAVLIALFAASCASTGDKDDRSDAEHIKGACAAFFKACASRDFDGARGALAGMAENVPEDYVLGRLRRYGKLPTPSAEKLGPAKVAGEKAVLVCREKPDDPDPFYFVREGGTWKILLPLTKYRHPCFAWSAEDLAAFAELETWFKAFKTGAPDGGTPR
jgi:hypothetical protein